MKLREQPLLCPHCQAELGINVYSKYFIYGTEHIECCPHCQRGMKPEKEPISVFRCFQFGIIFSVLASVGYLVFIEDDFLHAVLFTLLLFLIPLGFICMLIYQRINFIRTE